VEKYFSLQSIIGFLGTAVLDFAIVALILLRKPPPPGHTAAPSL